MATACAPNPVLDPAAAEALWLFQFAARNGESLASLRELIAVPTEIESGFRTFAQRHPEESIWIEEILSYRAAVLAEFDKLAADAPPNLPAEVAPANSSQPTDEEVPAMIDQEAALAFREEIAAASRFHHRILIG